MMEKREWKYDAEGEGAIWEKYHLATDEEIAEAKNWQAVRESRDRTAEAMQLACSVLSEFYGEDVSPGRHGPEVDGKGIPHPVFHEVPDVIMDAFALYDFARSSLALRRAIIDPNFSDMTGYLAKEIADCMFSAGKLAAAIRVRLDGAERLIHGRNKQIRNLAARPKAKVDAGQLKKEWAKAKQSRPLATKAVWVKAVAGAMGVSERTIRRRLNDHGIK